LKRRTSLQNPPQPNRSLSDRETGFGGDCLPTHCQGLLFAGPTAYSRFQPTAACAIFYLPAPVYGKPFGLVARFVDLGRCRRRPTRFSSSIPNPNPTADCGQRILWTQNGRVLYAGTPLASSFVPSATA
jgi:hypothetical protein